MYLRAVHAEYDIPTLRAFIRNNPLGIFTTAIESSSYPFIQSSHIPWLLDVQDETSDTELGTLRGHMARANPQAKAIIESLTREGAEGSHQGNNDTRGTRRTPNKLEKDVMVLFNAPVHHYVTPKFYKETKPSTGKVVPTWDYAAVQVYGKATIYFDHTSADAPTTSAYLMRQVSDLSQYSETQIMGYDNDSDNDNDKEKEKEKAWQVSDAPSSYVELLLKAIIGVEIEIVSMAGKFKMNQESTRADREGVIEGFLKMGSEDAVRMAEFVKARGELADSRKKVA
ncbi:unnamed protein product [Somion occarium]|uniref:Transcriptional regulator n=1 Tax=Somion occarium TaxID=3059160 RepID=A0ABP1DVG8_9APHY